MDMQMVLPFCSLCAALRDIIFDGELTAGWERYGLKMSGWVLEVPGVVCKWLEGRVWGIIAALSVRIVEDFF